MSPGLVSTPAIARCRRISSLTDIEYDRYSDGADRWDHPPDLAWLNSLAVDAAAAVVSAVDYLTEVGRGAQLNRP